MVVNDHVAILDLSFEPLEEAADVPRQRADVQRRRVRLADLPTLRVEDASAEILGLSNDRRVAHAEQNAGHLLCDGVERATEDAQGDRVDVDTRPLGRTGLATNLVLGDAHASLLRTTT